MAKTLSAKSRKPAKAKRAAPKKGPVKAKPPAMASAGDNAPLGTLDETQRANVKVRKQFLQTAVDKIHRIDTRIAGYQALLKPLRTEKNGIYRTVMTELGMTRKAVEFGEWLAELPKTDRATTIDQLRESVNSLVVGQQGSFLEVIDHKPPSKADIKTARDLGAKAYAANKRPADNPYNREDQQALFHEWAGSWQKAQSANAMKLGTDGKNGGKPATNKGAKHPPPEPVPGAVDNFERQAGDTVN